MNTYTYRNFYNGGGVAIGDINNDGLPDIYLTGNQVSDRLYLNKGHFHFEDITKKAGLPIDSSWSTGATFVDINGDGLLDLYVCKSGPPGGKNRHNDLYINQGIGKDGIPTFKEESAKYGLDVTGLATQAVFFDYDRDGDLDMYLLNNSFKPIRQGTQLKGSDRNIPDPDGGNMLFRNDGGHFTNVTRQAGIYSSKIGFGLNAMVADYNGDGWPDIYITNDYDERDYLYINNRNGTFTESLPDHMNEISLSSMGGDEGDINNDGRPDIYVTDMLPGSDARQKSKTTFLSWNDYQSDLSNGFYRQSTRNTLQLNNGDGTFSEIGRLAGVEATDWSWGTLIFDMNNDGWSDIFVANGIKKDLTDQDYLEHYASPRHIRSMIRKGDKVITKLVQAMSSVPVSNYAFKNNGNLTFTNMAKAWGLGTPGFSNGVAYADLNNDGALDLVINNVDRPAGIYKNRSDTAGGHNFLRVKLDGKGMNRFAIGADVYVRNKGKTLYREEMPVRGFQSSVGYVLHFGLGKTNRIDSLLVQWPDGSGQILTGIGVNKTITLRQSESKDIDIHSILFPKPSVKPLFRDMSGSYGIHFKHSSPLFDDFSREPLIPHVLSMEGPPLAKADVNGDGLTDFYVGGGKGQPGVLYIQQKDGSFVASKQPAFEADKISDDVDAVFFDANGDGYPDLYVASGGDEYSAMSPALQDRLYLNDGHGHFKKAANALPSLYDSDSCVRVADFNGDGSPDLFIGGRSVPWRYGVNPHSCLLINDGKGHFTDMTSQLAPALSNIGMVSDAEWIDYDHDGKPDLVLVGEWMPITLFHNVNGKLVNVTKQAGLDSTNGWWNCIVAGDFNGDGRTDLIAGNMGFNNLWNVSRTLPLTLYLEDFDNNGTTDPVICYTKNGKEYPIALRRDLVAQIPSMARKFPTHASYGGKTIRQIFSAEQLKKAKIKKAFTFASAYIENMGNGTFAVHKLPEKTQFSPIYAILPEDFNHDGHPDLLMGGNFNGFNPVFGENDASWGLYLSGDGKGHFSSVGSSSGFKVRGQVRSLLQITDKQGYHLILVARNNDSLKVFKVLRNNHEKIQ